MRARNLVFCIVSVIVLLSLLLTPGQGLAQTAVTFTKHTIAGAFDGAYSVYATDVDGDGDMDVLGAAFAADDITWWENNGSESFTEHTIAGAFDGARSVYAADVDSDGDMDVLGAAYVAHDITWWENNGSESFAEHTINGYFYGANSVYATDVDGDGDMDVLGAASIGYITWWENNGSESFAEHTIADIADKFGGACSVYAADVDSDGDMDVLGAAEGSDSADPYDIIWWENNGSESFAKHTIASAFDGASSVYAADVDSDGDMDVLGTAWYVYEITWWENNGSESFAEHTIATAFVGASVYAADVDSDGDMDVLGAAYGDDEITWWENLMPPVDTTPPAAVTDLLVRPSLLPGKIQISWTAPGDDGTGGGRAKVYDIRYSSSRITESTWDSATEIQDEPEPGNPGDSEWIVVSLPEVGKPLSFAIKTEDEAGNKSEVSNSPYLQDIGFRPKQDGYSFPNPDGRGDDFGAEELNRMFGEDVVCETIIDGRCHPKTTALLWGALVRTILEEDGVCEGMAVTSLRFFKREDDPGTPHVTDLDLESEITANIWSGSYGGTVLRKHMAYFFAEQLTRPVKDQWREALERTPVETLEALSASMTNGDTMVLGMYGRLSLLKKAGHSVSPYAIYGDGNGEYYYIVVYDNNINGLVGESTKTVKIDTINDTWGEYEFDPGIVWSGDANSKNFGVLSNSKRGLKPDAWSFSPFQALSGEPFFEVWLVGESHLLITDSQGRRIGYVGDQFVNEIPNAYENVIMGTAAREPIYTLPLNDNYSLLLDGPLTQTETVDLAQFGPGYGVQAGSVPMTPGSQDHLVIASDGTQITYQAGSSKEVDLVLALDETNQSYHLQVSGADIGVGQSVSLKSENGKLSFNNAQASGGTYDLEIRRVDSTGEQTFSHADLTISSTDTHYFDYAGWDGSGSMMLEIDHGSDGSIDETQKIENQSPSSQTRKIHLPLILKNH